ncbi:MAG: ribonuclease HII [Methanobacterium sp.]|uniref:ribonuclease HII n=1 Tax=Methanobacterium sp. TaxID=2164 RepID=UPI003D64D5B8|nr:ribonuclease HII [Methanobacterium sp.]
MKIVGIDEAGRGPVIGPLVVGGVAVEEEKLEKLEKLQLKDSKRLTPGRRKVMARRINKIAECHTVHIQAHDIDNLRSKNINLNEIEKIAIKKVIGLCNPDVAYIDCIDVKPQRFRDEMENFRDGLKVIAEHKAEDKFPIVAAASIIAKVERDMEIEKLKKEYKDIGSGYPSDPKTIAFLKRFSYENLPDFVRRSWATVQKNRK